MKCPWHCFSFPHLNEKLPDWCSVSLIFQKLLNVGVLSCCFYNPRHKHFIFHCYFWPTQYLLRLSMLECFSNFPLIILSTVSVYKLSTRYGYLLVGHIACWSSSVLRFFILVSSFTACVLHFFSIYTYVYVYCVAHCALLTVLPFAFMRFR